MKPYAELSAGERIAVTFVIVLAILFALALFGYLTGGWQDARAAPPSKQIALCSDEPGINDQINEIAFKALDDALRGQIERLFTTWMKDPSGQPERASIGVKQSALAYVHARAAILAWNIPRCSSP